MWIKANHEKFVTPDVSTGPARKNLCGSIHAHLLNSDLPVLFSKFMSRTTIYTGKIISAALLTMYRPVIISIIMVDWL